jgi:hypothetical protein
MVVAGLASVAVPTAMTVPTDAAASVMSAAMGDWPNTT